MNRHHVVKKQNFFIFIAAVKKNDIHLRYVGLAFSRQGREVNLQARIFLKK